jgi:Uma2 family endonuclease
MLLLTDLAPDTVRPLRRAEYERLVQSGAFDEDERIELLFGQLVHMSPQRDEHAFAVEELTERLVVALVGRARVRTQLPFAASDDSEPEPDVAVMLPRGSGIAHPTEVVLVIEVADASLRKDRNVKGLLYAQAGVPQYWIVNLIDRRIEVRRRPVAGQYAEEEVVPIDGEVVVDVFPDVRVPVSALFPPP